tara:strand:+ start:271 stop:708 length:438 start_codon:yes stop_codon:yes gene_type:complete
MRQAVLFAPTDREKHSFYHRLQTAAARVHWTLIIPGTELTNDFIDDMQERIEQMVERSDLSIVYPWRPCPVTDVATYETAYKNKDLLVMGKLEDRHLIHRTYNFYYLERFTFVFSGEEAPPPMYFFDEQEACESLQTRLRLLAQH